MSIAPTNIVRTNGVPNHRSSPRAPNTSSAMSGRINCRAEPVSANSQDDRCNRRCGWKSAALISDATVVTLCEQRVAQCDCIRVREAGQFDLRVAAAGRIQLQGSHTEAPLQRPLRDIRVLNARARHRDPRSPEDAAFDCDARPIDGESQAPVICLGPKPAERQADRNNEQWREQPRRTDSGKETECPDGGNQGRQHALPAPNADRCTVDVSCFHWLPASGKTPF